MRVLRVMMAEHLFDQEVQEDQEALDHELQEVVLKEDHQRRLLERELLR